MAEVTRGTVKTRGGDAEADAVAETAENRDEPAGIGAHRPLAGRPAARLGRIINIWGDRVVEGQQERATVLSRLDVDAERLPLPHFSDEFVEGGAARRIVGNGDHPHRARQELVRIDVVDGDRAAVFDQRRDARTENAIQILDYARHRGKRAGD